MSNEIVSIGAPLSIQQIKERVALVKQIVKSVMKDGTHFGPSFPGDKKKSLYQAGADVIALAFNFRPEYQTRTMDLGDGHCEFTTECILYDRATNVEVWRANASCNTKEKKYAYRHISVVSENPIPKDFWEVKRKSGWTVAQEMVIEAYGKGFKVEKIDDTYVVAYKQTVPNPDIEEVRNTCLQMSNKRAYVRACRGASCCSDIFTQDANGKIEPDDDEENFTTEPEPEKQKAQPKPVDKRRTEIKNLAMKAFNGNIDDAKKYLENAGITDLLPISDDDYAKLKADLESRIEK